jgi:hypothetical protein
MSQQEDNTDKEILLGGAGNLYQPLEFLNGNRALMNDHEKEVNQMNKRLLRFLQSGCLCLSATIPGAFAQESRHLMTADVPFEFQAGKETFPAGKYNVTSGSGLVVQVQTADHVRSLFSLTGGIQRRETQEGGTLVFNRYGERYFLSQIWLPGSNTGRLLHRSSAEREVARSIAKPATKTVAAAVPHLPKR